MFKIFCFKYRYKVKKIKYILRKSYIRFNYPRDLKEKRKIRTYSKHYIAYLRELLRIRIYYGDMTIKKFRKYLQRVNVKQANFEARIFILLETRIDILLFRLNLVKTPRESRHYIRCKKIKINNKKICILNRQLYINDVISFEKQIGIQFYYYIYKKIMENKILFNFPKYLEMNYNLMKCILIFYPKYKDVPTT